MYSNKKILLLGGSGYIGSKFYAKYNSIYQIKSVDLQLFSQDCYSQQINYNNTDIDNYDTIICLAGHSSVQMCEYSPERSWVNNIEYFHNLCKKINKYQKLIYMSSASVYGNIDTICYEDISLNKKPIYHYDLQKILIDIIANKYILEEKNIIGLRLGTVNGPSINTRSDIMLNAMVRNAIENKVVHVKNANIKRSILGINDLMRALSTIIDNRCVPGHYNLCSFTMTVGQLVESVYKILKPSLIQEPADELCYNFELSTDKFRSSMNFIFNDSPDSLIHELISNHYLTNYSTRKSDENFRKFM